MQSFGRYDDTADETFYAQPRKAVHLDDSAIEAVKKLYGELLPTHGRILDLMSSWRSHLPSTLTFAEVVGLGMNAEEMAENPQLTSFVVHNLNASPQLPFADASFDAAVCTVSVQYLTHPVAVFTDLGRVLTTGGVAVVTFSNRCFPTKAVFPWLSTDDRGRINLVTHFFQASGMWGRMTWSDRRPHNPQIGLTDPLYAVWAYKK